MSVAGAEEPRPAEPTPAEGPSEVPVLALPPEEDPTRVHGYSSDELAAARDPDAWGGGLRPFDQVRNYQLLSQVGTGGMAEVFLARCELGIGAEKLVALKMVRPQFGPGSPFGTLFLNEARVSASLQHPNLVQVFDTGEAVGRGYLAMEYVHGRSLAALIRKLRALGDPPPLGLAATVGIALCNVLEYLHTKRGLDGRLLNLVHRDLSPGNILISETGELKLVDFGVAAASAENAPEKLVVGKRAYMAPEQVQGESPNPSWDLYSLGVVLHELVTLEPLFEGDTPTGNIAIDRLRKHLPPSISNPRIPPALDRLVLWLTDPNPTRRAQTASAVGNTLEGLSQQLPATHLRNWITLLYGKELQRERVEIERRVAIAHSRRGVRSLSDGPFRHLTRMRRRVQTAPAWRRLTRHRQALQWALVALMGHLLFFGPLLMMHCREQQQIDRWLVELDGRVERAQLAGPGGDTALDALGELRRLAPADPRIRERTKELEDLFLRLARSAEARGDLGEAAVHYQAALDAEPTQPEIRARLQQVEAAVRKQGPHEAGTR